MSTGLAELQPDLSGAVPGRRWRGGWTALTVTVLARVVLSVLAGLLLCSLIPALFGWHPTVVMTGSMQPRLHTGDVVVSRPVPADTLQLGQVLLVADPDHAGRERLHRLVAFRSDGTLTLRGDANAADDSSPVARGAVHGVAALRVPFIGKPALWLNDREYLDLALLAGLLGLLAWATFLYRADDGADGDDGAEDADDSDEDEFSDRAATDAGDAARAAALAAAAAAGRAPSRRIARGGVASIVAVALFAGGIAAAAPAGAASRFSKASTNAADSWSAIPYFTCSAATLAANPYLYYQFAESNIGGLFGSTTADDSSPNGRDGTYQGGVFGVGGPTGGATGPCSRDGNTAVTLNGTSGYVSTPSLVTGPNVFTIEIWFKTTTTKGGRLIGLGSSQTGSSTKDDRHLYLANSGQVVFGVNPTAGKSVVVSPNSYNDGTWHLADASLSTTGMQLYVDGQLVGSNTTVTSAQSYSGYWRIGYDNLTGWGTTTPTSNFLAATLADAAVYTTALSATQIAGHYSAA